MRPSIRAYIRAFANFNHPCIYPSVPFRVMFILISSCHVHVLCCCSCYIYICIYVYIGVFTLSFLVLVVFVLFLAFSLNLRCLFCFLSFHAFIPTALAPCMYFCIDRGSTQRLITTCSYPKPQIPRETKHPGAGSVRPGTMLAWEGSFAGTRLAGIREHAVCKI